MEQHLNDKFYVPEIIEFHIGFEYEEFWKDVWTKRILDENDLNSSIDFPCTPCEINNNLQFADVKRYRVKYLDKEDIESLKWIYYKTLPGTPIMVYETKDYELWHNHATHHISIQMKEEGDSTLFAGIIKNISEFKIILKQLGITK